MIAAIIRNVRIASTLGLGFTLAACSAGTGTGVNASGGNPVSAFVQNTKLSYRPDTPMCDDPLVLARIQRRVPPEMRNMLHRHLAVESFEHPRQTGYVPADYLETAEVVHHPKLGRLVKKDVVGKRQLSQRYCQVRARFSDHHTRTVYYVTETPMGFAGVGHNMTYCVAGLDPWYVHGHNCGALRRH